MSGACESWKKYMKDRFTVYTCENWEIVESIGYKYIETKNRTEALTAQNMFVCEKCYNVISFRDNI